MVHMQDGVVLTSPFQLFCTYVCDDLSMRHDDVWKKTIDEDYPLYNTICRLVVCCIARLIITIRRNSMDEKC